MKNFNPDRELNKIKYCKRNKIILLCFLMIVVSIISYSFALYQVRHNKRIIYTTVDDFLNNKDIILTVLIDGKEVGKMPSKEENVYYDGVDCDNDDNASARWDYVNWRLTELNVTVPNKCNINFTKNYRDDSGANPPELYQGLIPITIDENGEIYVANLTSNWYDYDEKRWANAVLIDDKTNHNKYYNADGTYKSDTNIPMSDILQMYVWIPRYKYQLFNVNLNGNMGMSPQKIVIEFENKTSSTGETTCEIDLKGIETCKQAENDNYYTHPAFNFGNSTKKEENTELTGFWVGKFKASHPTKSNATSVTEASLGCSNNTCKEADNIRIIPSVLSIRFNNLANYFYASLSVSREGNIYNLESNKVDTHLIKNMEWGAVAYLLHSKYGRCSESGSCSQPTYNNSGHKTGYANATDEWYTKNGMTASSTENAYGVYDLNGATWEFVMVNMVDSNGNYYQSESGLEQPEYKYYDIYSYGTVAQDPPVRGHLGDAVREVFYQRSGWSHAWYDGPLYLPAYTTQAYPWGYRTGLWWDGGKNGVFGIKLTNGEALTSGDYTSFRIVVTIDAQ